MTVSYPEKIMSHIASLYQEMKTEVQSDAASTVMQRFQCAMDTVEGVFAGCTRVLPPNEVCRNTCYNNTAR